MDENLDDGRLVGNFDSARRLFAGGGSIVKAVKSMCFCFEELCFLLCVLLFL